MASSVSMAASATSSCSRQSVMVAMYGDRCSVVSANSPCNSSLNTRKLVRICLALLHRLCKDSDCSKKLIVEAGAMKPLCAKWFESVRRRFAESDLILSLLKSLTLFHDTQLAFIEQDGDKVLHALVHHEAPGA